MFSNYHFHHIGYATQSIENTALFFLQLGYTKTETLHDINQNVNIAFLKKDDSPIIELVELIDEKSPIFNILEKNGVTPYHICYEVNDIMEAITELRKLRFTLLFNPVNAIALDNRLICYLYKKEVGLIEILQK